MWVSLSGLVLPRLRPGSVKRFFGRCSLLEEQDNGLTPLLEKFRLGSRGLCAGRRFRGVLSLGDGSVV